MAGKLPRCIRFDQPRIFRRGDERLGLSLIPYTKTKFRKLRLFHGHDKIVKAGDGTETIIRIPASYRATLKAEGFANVR